MSDRLLPTHKIILALNGSPQYQETIAAGTGATVRNATAFVGGEVVMLQADQDFFVRAGQITSTVTALGVNAVKVVAGEKFYMTLGNGLGGNTSLAETHICCLGSTTTANIKVFRMR